MAKRSNQTQRIKHHAEQYRHWIAAARKYAKARDYKQAGHCYLSAHYHKEIKNALES